MLNLPPRLVSSQFANLHTFHAAARHLSFALAAEELCLTPSAVSHRIARLEQALNVRLFERLTRRIRLTAEGERIFAILDDTVNALDEALSPEDGPSGAVTLYAHPSIASDWLVPRLADFHRRYPRIALDVRVGNEPLDFRTRPVDLALVYAVGEPAGVNSQRLMGEAVAPVCSPGYAEAHDLTGNPHNLRQCTLLHDALAWQHAAFDAEWRRWAEAHDSVGHLPEQRLTFDRSDLCASAAVHHAGVAIGRQRLVQRYLDDGSLVLPLGGFEALDDGGYYLVWAGTQPRVEVVKAWLIGQV